ncbi:response regulator [Acinetobacter schindleri]|jgi:two-component system nitrate/nitrite response regulator NarL|uniref:response regulator n=1 Tax=Acinetobacter schindleri TaxID=108981 RepID=UPI00200A2A49|nr:response regulator [Acinetobacter schindleri]MCK8639503.1 response regulator [Acinetobacter schindleri]MCU4323251.1 response regulator [Acinetobacter schindleri]
MPSIQVSIVDDHALFRRGVADIIRQSDDFSLMQEYSSGYDFIQSLDYACPDILLLDIQMPEMSGIDVLKALSSFKQQLKIVMLTACEEEQALLNALRYGAHGFLAKDTLPEVILENLYQVYTGKTVLQERSIHILAQQFRSMPVQKSVSRQQHNADLLHDMTQREQETLQLIAKGLNNKLIARELGISDGTVKVYVKNLLRKLNVHSRLELSVWAHQNLNLSEFNDVEED